MLRKVSTTAAILLGSFLTLPLPVAAYENCEPYGICPPITDIEIGGVTITDEVLYLSAVAIVIGVVLLINGKLLLKRLHQK